MLLHCRGCGAEQDLAQSQPSSTVPVLSGWCSGQSQGSVMGPIGSPQYTKPWTRARGHPRGPAEGDGARERAGDPHPYGIAGTRSDSPRLGWNEAPGPWAGVDGGWAVSALRVLTASFIGKYLKTFMTWYMSEFSPKRPRHELIIHELVFHDGCEDLDKKIVSLIISSNSDDSPLGKNIYFNLKQRKNDTS